MEDTYQTIARKALRYMCQIYEEPIARTPMRFFPPFVKNSPIWQDRMQTLEGSGLREDDPTVVFMTKYLLALDEHYDKQARNLRKCIRRAEGAEVQIRRLFVQLAEVKAQATAAESREATAIEALKQAEDRHSQELKKAYLFASARRGTPTIEDDEAPILEGIPIAHGSGKRKCIEAPPAPPPTEASREVPEPDAVGDEEILPLTQPPPKDGGCSILIPLEDPSSSEE